MSNRTRWPPTKNRSVRLQTMISRLLQRQTTTHLQRCLQINRSSQLIEMTSSKEPHREAIHPSLKFRLCSVVEITLRATRMKMLQHYPPLRCSLSCRCRPYKTWHVWPCRSGCRCENTAGDLGLRSTKSQQTSRPRVQRRTRFPDLVPISLCRSRRHPKNASEDSLCSSASIQDDFFQRRRIIGDFLI